ncbi:MAPEG family protein [Novosphingobium lentum]|uniref:MAPEG family protein n=1 Tax=Novosphingobium lentum TaxID=145287 RepID=UPI00082DADD0|nr:MAPEG family protein [Novosphingobium lentum]
MLPITTLLAALAAVALVGLSFSVSLKRMKAGTDIGTGDDPGLLRRIRAQGNFVEYVPLALILCALAEFRGASPAALWTLAGLLVVGRAAHATGMLSGSTPLRAIGIMATYGALLTGAVAALSA